VTALVTDSSAQLPPILRDRYGVRTVPITIVIDGEPYREGHDLTTTEFYSHLDRGAVVSTAAPSPGEVLETYEQCAGAGATEILSIHVGANTSGTVNAVGIAAASSPVPVTIVDTGTASFAVGCCVWAAGDVIAAGGDLASAEAASRSVAAHVANVFIVGALDLARRGGRLATDTSTGGGVPVLAFAGGEMSVLAEVGDVEAAIDAMTDYVGVTAAGEPQRVGVGDALAPELADEYEARLRALPEVVELVRYEVGPSVGAHTGRGTVGACFFPTS
jgi:DegV family protein with EDD domain